MSNLTPEKGLIFRITHQANLPWILENGLHCRHSAASDPNYREIGSLELAQKRANREVPVPPHGTLADYIAFYFTPWSPMLYNIKTGHQGVPKLPMNEIAVLVSSVARIQEDGGSVVFTDRHAYLQPARFSSDVSQLLTLDWERLQARDFHRDPEDPERFERYQAEALVYRYLSRDSLLGIACAQDHERQRLEAVANELALDLKIITKPKWFFE